MKEASSGESSDHLVPSETGSYAESQPSPAPSPVIKRRESLRRASKQKVLQLNVDNTWEAAPKSSSKIKIKTISGRMSAVVKMGQRPEFCFKFVVAMLFGFIVSLSIVTMYLRNMNKWSLSQEQQIFFKENRKFHLLNSDGKEVITVNFGVNIPHDIKALKCFSHNEEGDLNEICYDWQYRARFNVDYTRQEDGIRCYHVKWSSYESYSTVLKDCFELDSQYWYGMGDFMNLSWPIRDLHLADAAFVTGHNVSEKAPFGSIIKRYWLSSKGISIRVPIEVPLFISYNSSGFDSYDSQLCFEARTTDYPYDYIQDSLPQLEYTICTGDDIIKLHTAASRNWTSSFRTEIQVPRKTPAKKKRLTPLLFLERPIWTTDTELFPEVTQLALHSYTTKIMSYGFEPGVIILDSRWENHVGDLKINSSAFHNPVSLFSVLHYQGFKVLLTVTPYIDITADILMTACTEKRVVVDPHTNAPLLTRCEEGAKGLCALLDLMNDTTREWFQKRLQINVLSHYTVDGLFMKGIDVHRMPHHRHDYVHKAVNPDYFQIWYKKLARDAANLVGMNVVAGLNSIDGVVQMPPMYATWKSLQSVIPKVLTLGIIGYPIINTGSVGGDKFENSSAFDRDLYIRWLELSAFLPTVQFAEPPGRNDLEIIRVAKKLSNIRQDHILPILKACLKEVKEYGWPIIRPMWWLDPTDPDAYQIDDQFVVGNDVIVAPILYPDMTERDIYLPPGWWRDEVNSQIMRGGKWVRNYAVDLYKVPYFKRTDPNAR